MATAIVQVEVRCSSTSFANLAACSTRSRTGRAVKRGGRPGQLHTDRPCSGEPIPALTRAPSRAALLAGPRRCRGFPPPCFPKFETFTMFLRVLLLFALLPPPADCWLGQQMAPLERCSLRCCDDAGEQPPAALRNTTPSPALVRPDGLSGSADCGAMSFDMQPVIIN